MTLKGARTGRRRVTSEDVARAAGVSRATVSYVLNDKPNQNISAATRELVLQKARELGHIPHAHARALRLGRSHVVLAIVGDFAIGYIRDELLASLDAELARRGYLLLVHRYVADLRPLEQLWPLVSPEMIVSMSDLSTDEIEEIRGARTPLVETRSLFQQRRAGGMQVDYLHSVGHTSLGYAFPTRRSVRHIAQDRLAGSRAAARRLGLPPLAVERVDRDAIETIDRALDVWLGGDRPVTAVCAHNDEIAAMIVLALARRGLRAGSDLAVMGVDDIPLARTGITTIALDAPVIAERIVEGVLAALENRRPKISTSPPLRLVRRDTA